MMEYRNQPGHWRREDNISAASVSNLDVAVLMHENFNCLFPKLIRSDRDRDIFHDTYLRMTRKYNPEEDFQEQFIRNFYILKSAYAKDDTDIRCRTVSLDDENIHCNI